MRPNYNKLIANINYNKPLPAKDVTAHLSHVITPRRQCLTHPLMEK